MAVQPKEMMGKQAGPERGRQIGWGLGRQIGRGFGRVMKIGPAGAAKVAKVEKLETLDGLARGGGRAGFCQRDYWHGGFECVPAIR